METQPIKRDEQLWKIAKERIHFRRHLINYVVFNLFFWAIWFFTHENSEQEIPWPCWSMVGWGIAIIFHYFKAYHQNEEAIQKEYEKLLRK